MKLKGWLKTPADWSRFNAWAKINAKPKKLPEPEPIVGVALVSRGWTTFFERLEPRTLVSRMFCSPGTAVEAAVAAEEEAEEPSGSQGSSGSERLVSVGPQHLQSSAESCPVQASAAPSLAARQALRLWPRVLRSVPRRLEVCAVGEDPRAEPAPRVHLRETSGETAPQRADVL